MSLLPVEQAFARLMEMAEAAAIHEHETVPLAAAQGRVLAEDMLSSLDLPPWPNSAMDGYALRVADWTGEPLRVSQRIFAGQAPQPLEPGTCARIFTGAPMPEGADCVEMQENAEVLDDQRVRFTKALDVGQNITLSVLGKFARLTRIRPHIVGCTQPTKLFPCVLLSSRGDLMRRGSPT